MVGQPAGCRSGVPGKTAQLFVGGEGVSAFGEQEPRRANSRVIATGAHEGPHCGNPLSPRPPRLGPGGLERALGNLETTRMRLAVGKNIRKWG
jgi:hypothetical protein